MLQTQTITATALTRRLMADLRFSNFVLMPNTTFGPMSANIKSLDLYSSATFDVAALATVLKKEYGAENVKIMKDGIYSSIDGIKTDIITHPHPEIEPHKTIDGIRIMSLLDMSAMKLHEMVQKGTMAKSLTDIYRLLEALPLIAMYDAYQAKYAPYSNWQNARLSLDDYCLIHSKDEGAMANRAAYFSKIISRIKAAIGSPGKLFPTVRHRKVNHILTPKTPK